MSESSTVAMSVEPVQGLSQAERVVDAFVAPTKTFTDILRSTSWWLPFLLLVLITLGVDLAVEHQVGFPRVAENMVHNSPKQEEALASLTPEQRAARMQISAKVTRYISYGSPLVILVFSAIGALGLWASFNFGLGARTTYPQIFCLWMFANLPRLLSALVTTVMLCFGGSPETFDLKQPAGTSIGYYLPDTSPWLRALLGSFDIVGFWVIALLIVGGAIVAKVKMGQAAAVVIGWWLLIVLVGVAATAAFS
jgi:Yip1 domain